MSDERKSQTAASMAVRALEEELIRVRTERDDFRDRWLRHVDINDSLRARLAQESTLMLEAMSRE